MLKVLQLAVGIYVAYLSYGLAQERIYKTPRGDDGEKFSYTLFVVFVQCIFNATAAYTSTSYHRTHRTLHPTP